MNIYAITNDVNDKVYVGATAASLNRRWNGHLQQAKHGRGYSLANAMRQFGIGKFHVTSVWSGYVSRDSLHELEKYFIKSFQSKSPNGYNETTGGWSRVYRPCSLEAKEKISAKLMGHHVSEETKEKIRNSPCATSFAGRTHTPEAAARIAASRRGKKASAETIRRLSESRKGKPAWNRGISPSDESRKKMSESGRGRTAWNKGLPVSEQSLKNLDRTGTIPWNKGKRKAQ